MDDDDWFPLAELTERLGGLAWVEQSVGDVLAGWTRHEADPAAAVFFGTTARHHQWHAEIVLSCLPTSPALLEQDPVRPPTQGWQRAVNALSTVVAPNSTATRLRAIVRTIDPWLQREIEALTVLARPVSDAAMQRWLRFVRIDHDDDGEVAAQLLANRADEAVQLDDHQLLQQLDLSKK